MPLRLSDLPADLLARLVQCTLNDEAAWAPVAPCDCDGGALQPAPIRALALRLRGIDKAFCRAVASPDAFPRLMSLHTYSSDPLALQSVVHTLGHAIGAVTLGVRLGEQRLRACLLRCVNATCLTIEDSPWPPQVPGGYAALQPEHLLRLLSGVLPKLTTLKVTVDSIWSDTYAARLAAVCPLLEALTVYRPQIMLTNMPLVSYRPFANLREVALVSDQSSSVQDLLDTLAACPRLQKLGGLMLDEYGPDIAELDCSALSQLSELTLAPGPQGRSLPCLLRQCSNLTKLGLRGVRVEGSSIRQLVAALTCKLASLELGRLEDDGEDICDADVISLCGAQPALTALSLLTTEPDPLIARGYDITDNALTAMHSLQSLELLRIEDANMENISVAALDALVRACPRLRKVVLARVGEPDDWTDDAQPSSNALRAVDELLRERGGELEDGDVLEESDSDDTTDSEEEGI